MEAAFRAGPCRPWWTPCSGTGEPGGQKQLPGVVLGSRASRRRPIQNPGASHPGGAPQPRQWRRRFGLRRTASQALAQTRQATRWLRGRDATVLGHAIPGAPADASLRAQPMLPPDMAGYPGGNARFSTGMAPPGPAQRAQGDGVVAAAAHAGAPLALTWVNAPCVGGMAHAPLRTARGGHYWRHGHPDRNSPSQAGPAGGRRARALHRTKKKATTHRRKSIIEVVALMFQSILAEDRMPASRCSGSLTAGAGAARGLGRARILPAILDIQPAR